MRPAHVSALLGAVASNVRRLRAQRGLTQERLAEEAELDLSFLQRVERAAVNASLGVVAALAAALDVAPATLLADAAPPVVKRGRPKALVAVYVDAAAPHDALQALETPIKRPKHRKRSKK